MFLNTDQVRFLIIENIPTSLYVDISVIHNDSQLSQLHKLHHLHRIKVTVRYYTIIK